MKNPFDADLFGGTSAGATMCCGDRMDGKRFFGSDCRRALVFSIAAVALSFLVPGTPAAGAAAAIGREQQELEAGGRFAVELRRASVDCLASDVCPEVLLRRMV